MASFQINVAGRKQTSATKRIVKTNPPSLPSKCATPTTPYPENVGASAMPPFARALPVRLRLPVATSPHVIKQEKREPGGNWARSRSPALPPNADPTDRRTGRPTEFPSAFACHGKEAKLNWLKNDGTAASSPLSPKLISNLTSSRRRAGGRAGAAAVPTSTTCTYGKKQKEAASPKCTYLGSHKKHRENRY